MQDAEASRLRRAGETVSRGVLGALGVAFTPTILAVDSRGEVIASWVGTVAPDQVGVRVAELTAGRGARAYRAIEWSDAEALVKMSPDSQVLGLMGSQANSPFGSRYKVIPANELVPRARYELRPDVPTVVDCDAAKSFIECQSALVTLSQIYRFKRLFAVGLKPAGPRVLPDN